MLPYCERFQIRSIDLNSICLHLDFANIQGTNPVGKLVGCIEVHVTLTAITILLLHYYYYYTKLLTRVL